MEPILKLKNVWVGSTDKSEMSGRKNLENLLSWLNRQDFKHDFVQDRLAPSVDKELIHKFVAGDLAPAAQDETLSLIMSYRSWFEFCLQAIEESKKN